MSSVFKWYNWGGIKAIQIKQQLFEKINTVRKQNSCLHCSCNFSLILQFAWSKAFKCDNKKPEENSKVKTKSCLNPLIYNVNLLNTLNQATQNIFVYHI